MACNLAHKKSKDNLKQVLLEKGIVDTYLNILDYPEFIRVNNQLNRIAEQTYKISGYGNPFLVSDIDETKAIVNNRFHDAVDSRRKFLGLYEDQLAASTNNKSELAFLTDSQILNTEVTPELRDRLIEFTKKLNPDFKIEVVDNLLTATGDQADGIAKIKEFLIQLRNGRESVLPEEVSHFFISLLPNDHSLKVRMNDEITRTRIYKQVMNDYREVYKGNPQLLKEEAMAKLVAIYLTDPKLFKYWSGSDSLVDNLTRWIKDFFQWLKGKGKSFSSFIEAAEDIVNLDTSKLNVDLAESKEEMYAISDWNKFQSLNGKTLGKYDRILFNINDTLLDYVNYPGTSKEKRDMLFNKPLERDRYFSSSKLTVLGREIRDKIEMGLIESSKLMVYTQMTVSDALVNRLNREFGILPKNIIQVNKTEFYETEDGTPVEVSGVSFLDQLRELKIDHPNLVVIDNAVINTEGLTDIQPYRNKKAEYTSPQRLFEIQQEKKNKKEITTRFIRELNQVLGVDKKTLTERMIEASNIVSKQLSKIEYMESILKNEENNDEVDRLFRDNNGLLSLPKDKAQAVRNLIENTKDYERAVLEFVAMIEATTAFFKERNDSGYQVVKDAIDRGDENSLRELNLIVQMGKRWQEYTAQFYKDLSQYPGTNEMSGLMGRLNNEITKSKNIVTNLSQQAIQNTLSPIVTTSYNEIRQQHIDDKIKLREEALTAGDEKLADRFDVKIEELKNGLLTPENITKALNGELEDISSITTYIKPLHDVGDMLIGGVAKLIKRQELEVDIESIKSAQEFGEKVEGIKRDNGITQQDIEENLITTELVRVWNPDTQAYEYKPANALLNPWLNREDFYVQREPLDKARLEWQVSKKADIDEEETERLFQTYLEQKKIFEAWRHENWFDEYTDDFYTRYNRLKETPRDAEIYEKAVTLQGNYWREVNSLREQLEYETENNTIDDLNNKIKDTIREAKNLRSKIDLNGNNKVGEDLEIAEMLQRKLEIDKEVYEYKSNSDKFKKDFKTLVNSINSLILRDDVKQTLLFKLEGSTDSFTDLISYAKQEATEEIIDWLERNTVNRYSDTFYENRKKIVDELSAFSAELAGLYGEDTTPVNEIWEKLFNETSYLRDEDGIFDGSNSTPQTQKTVKDYEAEIERLKSLAKLDRVDLFDALTTEEKQRVNQLKKLIGALITELQEIQSRQVTDYYMEHFIDKANETGFLSQFSGNLSYGTNLLTFINSDAFSQFKVNNPDHPFIQWFEDNHYWKETFEAGQPIVRLSPTYIWFKIEPTNGSDILTVPSWKYSNRVVKPEFKTDKENWKTWNPIKGTWLPKSSKYKNAAFDTLRNRGDQKGKGLYSLLQLMTDFHLGHQEDAPKEAKLEFVLPYVEKKEIEGNIFKSMYNQFIDKNNRFEQGEGNFDETEDKQGWDKVKAKLAVWYNGFVNNTKSGTVDSKKSYQRVAVPYSKYASPEDVSKDITLMMVMFSGTTNKAKVHKDLIPLVNLIKENLSDQSTRYTKEGKVKNPNSNRLEAIEHLENTKFYGQNKQYELGVKADRIVTQIRKLNTLGSQSDIFGFFNNIKNNFQGRLQNFINAEFADWSSPSSMRKASTNMKTNLFKYLYETDKPLDKRSKDYHILTYFLPTLTGHFRQMLLKGAPKNIRDNQMGYYFSMASEFGLASTSLYGHLYHVKVEKNGETKTLYDILKVSEGSMNVEEGWKVKGRDRIVNMNYLLETNTAFISVQEYMQGKAFDKTKLATYTLGQAVLYFKSWLIPMLRRRFDKSRPNYMVNEDVEGYWRTFLRLTIKISQDFFKEGKTYWATYTEEEKRNYLATCKEIGVMFASLLVLSLVFGFDADDPDKFKKLQDNGYFENVALLIALQTKNETESLSLMPFLNIEQGFVPPVLTEGAKFKDKPFIGMAIIDDTWKLMNATFDLAMQNDNAYYDKNMPAFNIDKGDTKAGHYFLKISQIDDLINLSNPEGKIQQVISNLKR